MGKKENKKGGAGKKSKKTDKQAGDILAGVDNTRAAEELDYLVSLELDPTILKKRAMLLKQLYDAYIEANHGEEMARALLLRFGLRDTTKDPSSE
jgi:hypothetical protein